MTRACQLPLCDCIWEVGKSCECTVPSEIQLFVLADKVQGYRTKKLVRFERWSPCFSVFMQMSALPVSRKRLSYEDLETWGGTFDSGPRTMKCQTDTLMLLNVTQQICGSHWWGVRLWKHESSRMRKSDPDSS